MNGSHHPLRTFLIVWLGQLISFIGSGLSSFALGIYVYEKSASIADFSMTSFAYYLPQLMLSPIAGALIDRWDRRRAMLLADLGAALCTLLGLALVFASEAGTWNLESWHLFLCIAATACFSAFRGPALLATTALLMPGRHLARANSLLELAAGTGQIVAPVLAGVLISSIHLSGLLLIDVLTFSASILALMLVRFPAPPLSREGQEGKGSLQREIAVGWRFIRARRGLVALLVFNAAANLILAIVLLLLTPLALSLTDTRTLGVLMSTSGSGMMVGALMMSVWGGPARRMHGVIAFTIVGGMALIAMMLPPNLVLLGAAVFVFLFTVPVVSSCAQTMWQLKVPPDMQGRVFAVRRMIALAAPPLAALVAGTLAEEYFEPWMMPHGELATSVGQIMGTGPGRGVALLLALLGVLSLGAGFVAWISGAMRRLEDELPNACHHGR